MDKLIQILLSGNNTIETICLRNTGLGDEQACRILGVLADNDTGVENIDLSKCQLTRASGEHIKRTCVLYSSLSHPRFHKNCFLATETALC